MDLMKFLDLMKFDGFGEIFRPLVSTVLRFKMTQLSPKLNSLVKTCLFWTYFESLRLLIKIVKNHGLTPLYFLMKYFDLQYLLYFALKWLKSVQN